MNLLASLAAIQGVVIRTPDTTGYLRGGYLAIGLILGGYALFLWGRARKARQE